MSFGCEIGVLGAPTPELHQIFTATPELHRIRQFSFLSVMSFARSNCCCIPYCMRHDVQSFNDNIMAIQFRFENIEIASVCA